MDIDTLLSRHSSTYRFHGVRAETLEELVRQSQNGQIVLWGRNPEIDEDEAEDEEHYLQGAGILSVTRWHDVEMSCQEFCNDGGLVLVLEPVVSEPQEDRHPTDRREWLISASEWKVIGGLRPSFEVDEEGDELVGFQAVSLEEIMEGE